MIRPYELLPACFCSWLLMMAGAVPAVADQQARPDAAVCSAERKELDEVHRALDTCRTGMTEAEQKARSCGDELKETANKLSDRTTAARQCQEQKDALCSASGALARGVVEGKSPLSQVPGCVPAALQSSLSDLVDGWTRSQLLLSAMDSFESGESEVSPHVDRHGRTPIERLAQRLAAPGMGQPLLAYRRLLIEAIRKIAPRYWRRLRNSGRAAIDNWFTSSADFDPAFVAEIQSGAAPKHSAADAGTSFSVALRLVQSYLELAGCEGRSGARPCARARVLQTLLESSGALVLRQREQEIWATSCLGIDPKVVLWWLREFPSSHSSLGRPAWTTVTRASYDKLVTCYLADANAGSDGFADWLKRRLPAPKLLTAGTLARVDALRSLYGAAAPETLCLAAADQLRNLPAPTTCSLPATVLAPLRGWFESVAAGHQASSELSTQACAAWVGAMWSGRAPTVPITFTQPPTAEELVHLSPPALWRPMSGLRRMCAERMGSVVEFPKALRDIASLARLAGEDITHEPWRLDAGRKGPAEDEPFRRALTAGAWAGALVLRQSPCATLGLDAERCARCRSADAGKYDCALLGSIAGRWSAWTRALCWATTGLVVLVIFVAWSRRFVRNWRRFGRWRRQARAHFQSIPVGLMPDRKAWLLPSRLQALRLKLPADANWERWGRSAVLVRVEGGKIREKHINRAATFARSIESELALVVHDDGAGPELGAVRGMLDWAARGARRAVQVLPVSWERLRWTRSYSDLLDLVDQTSLRGNPFEVRGRLVSSSQFFDRERLVSGLLAAAQAGQWTVVTGLRRFGKSSLALEVGRRLTGPSAYVDLAGFQFEMGTGDPAGAADAIVRYLCLQLEDSAKRLYGKTIELPGLPASSSSDTNQMARWFRAFFAACRAANGQRAPAFLLIFDEVEQAIGVGPGRIVNAMEALSILIGRLRTCLSDHVLASGGDRVGVIFCSAIHPLLWAPLSVMSQQSLLGAFPSVVVSCMPTEAAHAMMRGLGARQGIRFTDAALDSIVEESAGIPLLARRLGSAVLELYDPQRARQGSLGAVEIGVEGAAAAVRREEEDGAPLRVWVESEIGDPQNPAGAILRQMARQGSASVDEIKALAIATTRHQFAATGISSLLAPSEVERRCHEAAGYIVRMLGETGLLEPQGDLTRPGSFVFPNSIVRRILAATPNVWSEGVT